MDTSTALPLFLLLMAPGVLTAVMTAILAPRLNRDWRERRAAAAAARAATAH